MTITAPELFTDIRPIYITPSVLNQRIEFDHTVPHLFVTLDSGPCDYCRYLIFSYGIGLKKTYGDLGGRPVTFEAKCPQCYMQIKMLYGKIDKESMEKTRQYRASKLKVIYGGLKDQEGEKVNG